MTTRTEPRAVGARASSMSTVDWIAMILLIVGGLNWGLVGLLDVDLVATLFGDGSAVSRIVYILVGLAALWCLYTATKPGSRQLFA